MHLVVVHRLSNQTGQNADSLLRLAFSNRPITDVLFKGLSEWNGLKGDDFIVAIPKEWKHDENGNGRRMLLYEDKIPVPSARTPSGEKSWYIISNGRFLVRADSNLLAGAVQRFGRDVVAVNIDPTLRAGSERTHTDSQHNLLGFRLLYSDAVEAAPIPADWPHLLFINTRVVDRLFRDKIIPAAFGEFIDRCNSNSASFGCLYAGGTALDLNTEKGLLAMLTSKPLPHANRSEANGNPIPAGVRMLGEVAFGRDVGLGENAVVAGPSVLCDSARIADGAIIQSSIIGPNVSIPAGAVVRNRVIADSSCLATTGTAAAVRRKASLTGAVSATAERGCHSPHSPFRTWPRLSYARCMKRLADVLVASIVLVIFTPFVPVIALIIKLSSKGPVFFKSIRQGLHGKPFTCHKFRTMQVGAHRLQDELRDFNEADGPQFVIAGDPRMSSRVGRFLRETYIDEIPQFFDVLLGRMSVVGPRPSPESENVLCPFWRDARLSVRPGITGLWQVRRTRKPMMDFQEWIHYDVEYVRNLSPAFDLWICWKTFLKMVKNFVRQF